MFKLLRTGTFQGYRHAYKRAIHTSRDEIPSWPARAYPTPYEIFGTSPSRFDKHEVRRVFVAMARAYHPDSPAYSQLTARQKSERFSKIVEAYEILKNDSKRRDWNVMHQRFDFSPAIKYSGGKFYGPVGRYGHAKHGAQAGAGADAFTDEDIWWGGDAMFERQARARRNDQEFQENLRKNRNQMFLFVCAAVAIVAYVQITTVYNMSEKQVVLHNHESYRTRLDEINAQMNYGRGSMQDERIARFLATRQNGSYYNKFDQHDPPLAIEGKKE